jgi:hypothetical protein
MLHDMNLQAVVVNLRDVTDRIGKKRKEMFFAKIAATTH